MNNFNKMYPNIDISNLKTAKGFYKSVKNIIQSLELSSNNTYLISYDYVEPLNKKIITVRICEKLVDVIQYLDNLSVIYGDFHINYIFYIQDISIIHSSDHKSNFKTKYKKIMDNFYYKHRLTNYNPIITNYIYKMNLSSLIKQTEQYIFNKYVLYDEFTTILQLIKKENSSVVFINDSVYTYFMHN